jgi:pimeloyl-ACP methyl ester carboxylesterase
MLTNTLRNLFFFASLLLPVVAVPTDQTKEQRWADQIVDSLLDGEAVWMEAGDQRFLGIFTPDTSGTTKGAVILLHGMGVHPNWPDVIYPLRTSLPEHGWATLSIQLPVLNNDAVLKDYLPLIGEAAPRIEAAVKWLESQDFKTIALVGHSLGATMGAACIATDAPPGIDALAVIGMGTSTIDPKTDNVAHLEQISIPVLDLYGSRDLEGVRKSAKERAGAARKAGNKAYRQIEVEGADHFSVGLEEELVRRVRGWLDRLAEETH